MKKIFLACLLKFIKKGYKIIHEKGSDWQKRLIKIYSISKKCPSIRRFIINVPNLYMEVI